MPAAVPNISAIISKITPTAISLAFALKYFRASIIPLKERINSKFYNLKMQYKNLPSARPGYSNRLYHSHDELEEENEKENHKIEGGVRAKSLIGRTVPAEERERCEQQCVENRQPQSREIGMGE